ncbi:MAG: hypothetical protein SVU88_04865 [Candidatus Nanohaloarchaea archaeon]|nr:hypothetical protein [Candidatus Nanohaloarchaea archaeon]
MDLLERVDLQTAAVTAALSLVAMLPLFVVKLDIGTVIAGDIVSLATALVPVALLLPLPAAYIAAVSRHEFRPEAFAAMVTLPLAVLGATFAGVSIGLVLGMLLVSYKARSVYHGDNEFWTFFKASTALITVMALVLGISAAYAYSSSATIRGEVRGNLTAVTVETATEFVDLSGGSSPSSQVSRAAVQIARNVSEQSIVATEEAVFQAVAQDGTFSDQQRQVLRTAFDQSRQQIPDQLSTAAQQQIESQLQARGGVEEEIIRSRTAPIIETVTAPTAPVLAAIALAVVSLVYILKFPVGLLGGIYGTVVHRIRTRGRRTGKQEEQRRQR